MLKRHEVEILLKAGHAKAEIARLSGVSRRSVQRIAEESAVLQVEDEAERSARSVGPVRFRISGNRWWGFCSKSRIWRRWRYCGGRERRAMRAGRRHSTGW